MSLITKGLDILSARLGLKRSRPTSQEAPAPHHRPSASHCTEEQAMQELGRCSLHTGGSGSMESALKRSRLVKTDPGAGASDLPSASGQVGARHGWPFNVGAGFASTQLPLTLPNSPCPAGQPALCHLL